MQEDSEAWVKKLPLIPTTISGKPMTEENMTKLAALTKMVDEVGKVCTWISRYVESAGAHEPEKKNGVVIGLSGGVDSSVVASLCARALGPDHVLGVIMPCGSDSKDEEHAYALIDKLGIRHVKCNLEVAFKAFAGIVNANGTLGGILGGNLKARLRMSMLYFWANMSSSRNLIVAGTGNKSEHMIGYFTKYGDGATDFEPICDFYKTEVFEMAKVLGVPEEIIDKPPSAGLWDGQTDEGELGISYKELDAILSDLNHCKADEATYRKVRALMEAAEHKTKLPPFYKRPEPRSAPFTSFDPM